MSTVTPRIGRKTREAIQHMVDGRAKSQSAAARLVGMSRAQFCRALKQPHVAAYAADQAKLYLKGFPALAAAARFSSLVNAKSEEVAFKVSQRLLEGAGILDARETAQTGGAAAGPVLTIVFKHTEIGAPDAHTIDVTPQPTETAATLMLDHSLVEGVTDRGALPGDRPTGEGGLKKRDASPDHHPAARMDPKNVGR